MVEILEQMEHAEVRRLITEDKIRPDGRRVDEIRPLDAEIDFSAKCSWIRSLYTWANPGLISLDFSPYE